MADPSRRRPENAAGEWFVDDTCIDCGTCMWMAPGTFRDDGGQSAVHTQARPRDPDASAALFSCPTGSIGGPAASVEFPRPVPGVDGAWHMGFHDRRSFGAAAWLARTEAGNVLIDVPRPVPRLMEAVERMGGLAAIFLTHRDDVAGHQAWHDRFGAPRIIHEADRRIDAEISLEGPRGHLFGLDWTHVPGHTEGSVVYRRGNVLFTGDHLAGGTSDPERLQAFRRACWYDWEAQRKSMASHAGWPIEHVLPGHGAPWHGTPEAYQAGMEQLVEWMATA